MDFGNAAVDMGGSTAGLPNTTSPLVTYKRRKRDPSIIASTSSALSDTPIEEESDELLAESECPSFRHLRSETPKKGDTVGRSGGAVRTVPEPKRTVAPPSSKRSRQYFLDLGQADFTHTTCRTCGCVYARGLESDEKIHNVFHRSHLKGISFKGWINERVAHHVSSAGDRVIYVLPSDPPCHFNKVTEVVKVMEKEMGLSPGWLWDKELCKVYLFISASKKIVGCLVAERIESAYSIVPRDQEDKVECKSDSSPNRLNPSKEKPKTSAQLFWGGWKFKREVNRKKSRNDNDQDLGRAVLCSKTELPAVCGVRGIWVSLSERRKGVASHLLDAMRKTFCMGVTLEARQCAFSQPSPAGEAFAARYCGTRSFLVYQSPLYIQASN